MYGWQVADVEEELRRNRRDPSLFHSVCEERGLLGRDVQGMGSLGKYVADFICLGSHLQYFGYAQAATRIG